MDAADARMMKRKAKAAAPERLSKAECHARMRARIEAVGQVLNLSKDEIKPALSLKHEQVGIFAGTCGLKLDWLIAGVGRTFQSRDELFELAVEYELRLKVEKALQREVLRLGKIRKRLYYQKLGVDPDNKAHRDLAERAVSFGDRQALQEEAAVETGYSPVWTRYNDANKQTNRLARKIFGFPPPTSKLALLVRLRVIETNDSAFRKLPETMMWEEIQRFFAELG